MRPLCRRASRRKTRPFGPGVMSVCSKSSLISTVRSGMVLQQQDHDQFRNSRSRITHHVRIRLRLFTACTFDAQACLRSGATAAGPTTHAHCFAKVDKDKTTYTNSTQVSSTILWSVPFCGAGTKAAAMSYMKSIHAAKKASEGTMVRNEFEGPLDILIVSPAKGEPGIRGLLYRIWVTFISRNNRCSEHILGSSKVILRKNVVPIDQCCSRVVLRLFLRNTFRTTLEQRCSS